MEKVALAKCDTYDDKNIEKALDQVLKHLGGLEKFIQPGMKVLIKPNLLMRKRPDEAGTTHPALVKAIAQKAVLLGAKVTIADSPGGFYNEGILKSVYSYCGYKEIPEQTGAILNYDTSMIEVPFENGVVSKKLTVIKPAAEADFIISVPKLKTHGMMVFTGAVKNLFGLIPGTLKAEYHLRLSNYKDFSNLLVDICECFKPGLTIMDAVEGMEGHGPSAGTPRHLGAVIASTSPYAVDIAATQIINLKPEQVFTMSRASERGLPFKLDDIEIMGESLETFKVKDFKIPTVQKEHLLPNNKVLKFVAEYLRPKPVFQHDICIKCKECGNHCPPKAISFETGKPVVDLNKCIRCFCCQELCPKKAIYIKRPWITQRTFRNK